MPLWHQAAHREGRWHIDGFGALVRSDIEENLQRPATLLTSITAVLLSRGVQAALLYRTGHALHRRGLSPVSEILLRISQLAYGVGDDVHIFAGAVVLGPIRVGAGSVVGANAVLTTSCPARSRVLAAPARITALDKTKVVDAG